MPPVSVSGLMAQFFILSYINNRSIRIGHNDRVFLIRATSETKQLKRFALQCTFFFLDQRSGPGCINETSYRVILKVTNNFFNNP